MVTLDITVVNVALPSIAEDLAVSQGDLQWVITACVAHPQPGGAQRRNLGIEAVEGVLDGGGNRASGNGIRASA
jgi:hypothetical protein